MHVRRSRRDPSQELQTDLAYIEDPELLQPPANFLDSIYFRQMDSFYYQTLQKVQIPHDASILVICGGEFDREVLLSSGFTSVTISNLDERLQGDEFAPFSWSFQDAEQLSFQEEAFDYAIVHAGLHHCASPHRALLEMYRVARRGILVFEARDNLLMKVAKKMNMVPSYEDAAVRTNEFRWGGVRNSCVPNYIYRWTEDEVRKTIASYAPHAPHDVRFFYGVRLPPGRLPFQSNRFLRWIPSSIRLAVTAVAKAFQKQGNLFAFYVEKPGDSALFPWLKSRTEFNREYNGI
jgi:SAM-dependent methyltransferase